MIQTIRFATSGLALAAFALVATGAVHGWPLAAPSGTGAKLYAERLPSAPPERDTSGGARPSRPCSAWPYEGARCVASAGTVTVEERPEPGLSRLVRVPAEISVADAGTAGVLR
ncbi:MAG: hypothetical protein PGN34_00465 [Methylobacterium frigidaeris]